MEQFSLDKYLENPSRKVVTRNERPVCIICTNRKSKSGNIVGFVGEDESFIYVWNNDGKHIVSEIIDNDLFFADEEEKTIDDTEMNSLAYLTELGYTCIPPKKEEDLDEAAKEYSFNVPTQLEVDSLWKKETEQYFKDGAKWQKQKDEELFSEDTWNYIEENYPNITKEEKLRLYDVSIKSRLAGAKTQKKLDEQQ